MGQENRARFASLVRRSLAGLYGHQDYERGEQAERGEGGEGGEVALLARGG